MCIQITTRFVLLPIRNQIIWLNALNGTPGIKRFVMIVYRDLLPNLGYAGQR